MTFPLKIAVVEDHADLRELFVQFLRDESHDVKGFSCAEELDEHIAGENIDLLVLDLNLPGEDGFSIARRLRSPNPDLNIIMITARSGVDDRVSGYLSGADIYLAKPVSPRELGAAVHSVARRIEVARSRVAGLTLDMVSYKLTGPAGVINISVQEAHLLKCLAEAHSQRLEYWRLLEILGIDQDDKGKAALEVRISRLKKKMHEVGAGAPAIKSLWKEGYQLCTPLQTAST